MRQKLPLNNTRVAICAIFKNEAPYILEWLAHHQLIGVTDFYIADNISTDGTSELLSSLHNDGLITRLLWPTKPGVKPQLPAYERLAELAINDGVEWALFIDADEFIILNEELHDIQSAIINITQNDESIAGIALNWATYGSSGIIINSGNNVLENFNFRFKKDSNINRHYKSLIKLKNFLSAGTTPHEFKIDKSCKYVNSAGIEIPQPLLGMSDTVSWSNMKIHHYMIKSKSEYVSKKMLKGRASSSATLDMTYFNAHDVNHDYVPLKPSLLKTVSYYKKNLQQKYLNANHDTELTLYFERNSKHIGAIDNINYNSERQIEIIGWAISEQGVKPHNFRVLANEHIELFIKSIKFKDRPDVFKVIDLCNDESCGFIISCDLPENEEIHSVSIYHGNNPIVSTGNITFQIKKIV